MGREPCRTGNPPVTLDRPQSPSGIARCQRGIELERTCPLVTGARSSDGPLLGSGGNRGACRASVLGDTDVRGNLPRWMRSRSSPSRPSTSKAPANSSAPRSTRPPNMVCSGIRRCSPRAGTCVRWRARSSTATLAGRGVAPVRPHRWSASAPVSRTARGPTHPGRLSAIAAVDV